MKREFHARFCERPEGKFLRPTHQRAQHLTPYSNSWKQFYCKFRSIGRLASPPASSSPANAWKSIYAGDPIEWFDLKTGEIRQSWVFVAVLGFSLLLYARAAEDMQREPPGSVVIGAGSPSTAA